MSDEKAIVGLMVVKCVAILVLVVVPISFIATVIQSAEPFLTVLSNEAMSLLNGFVVGVSPLLLISHFEKNVSK